MNLNQYFTAAAAFILFLLFYAGVFVSNETLRLFVPAWIGDKNLHLFAFIALSFSVFLALPYNPRYILIQFFNRKNLLISAPFLLVTSLLAEVAQSYSNLHMFDIYDVYYNIAGVFFGLVCGALFDSAKRYYLNQKYSTLQTSEVDNLFYESA